MNVSDFLILMVEDDADQVLFTKRALARANLVNPFRIVSNGEQAIAYLSGKEPFQNRRENPMPSLVLLDLKLPGMGGLEVLEWVRERPDLRNLSVAVVTASINPKDRQRADELGVDAYLCKPIDSEGLMEMMKSIGMYWMILKRNPETCAFSSPSSESCPLPQVLILHQDRDFLGALSDGLRRRSPAILSDLATNPEEALSLLESRRYAAAVLETGAVHQNDAGATRLSEALKQTPAILLSDEGANSCIPPALSSRAVGTVNTKVKLKKCIDDLHQAIATMLENLPPSAPEPVLLEPHPEHHGLGRNDTEILGDQVRFQKTSWELVRSAGESQGMDELIRIYWKPLYYFIRQKGFDNETAKDMVQDFLADALERNTIAKADPARGKFRTFLLAALSNFIKDWHKASSRLKRGGGKSTYSLDFDAGEHQYAMEVASGETPETVLNRAWAQSTLDKCISELTGNPAHLHAFRMMLQGARYSEIAKETGLSESAAKAAVCRLRQQLRDEVLRKVGGSEDRREMSEFDITEFTSLLR